MDFILQIMPVENAILANLVRLVNRNFSEQTEILSPKQRFINCKIKSISAKPSIYESHEHYKLVPFYPYLPYIRRKIGATALFIH